MAIKTVTGKTVYFKTKVWLMSRDQVHNAHRATPRQLNLELEPTPPRPGLPRNLDLAEATSASISCIEISSVNALCCEFCAANSIPLLEIACSLTRASPEF